MKFLKQKNISNEKEEEQEEEQDDEARLDNEIKDAVYEEKKIDKK